MRLQTSIAAKCSVLERGLLYLSLVSLLLGGSELDERSPVKTILSCKCVLLNLFVPPSYRDSCKQKRQVTVIIMQM